MKEQSHRNEARGKVFESLLRAFRDDVVKEFQGSISLIFQMPSSLWIYDSRGTLEHIKPANPTQFYPDYCRTMNSMRLDTSYCSSCDQEMMGSYIQNAGKKNEEVGWQEIPCPFGLSRIAIPIVIEGNAVGALTLGKYLGPSSEQAEEVCRKTKEIPASALGRVLGLTRHETEEMSKKLLDQIDTIPRLTAAQVREIASQVGRFVPLMKSVCSHVHPKDQRFDKLIFLDSIAMTDSSLLHSQAEMWSTVGDILTRICTKIRLRRGVVYLSDKEDFNDLLLVAHSASPDPIPDILPLASQDEFRILNIKRGGLLVPSNDSALSWLSSTMVQKLFSSANGIIYLRTVFSGKIVLIGFGFDPSYSLDEFDRHLLRESVERLFSTVHDVLSRIEIDHLMAESGHMLRRACSSIKAGIDTFKTYGYYATEGETEVLREARDTAYVAIDAGISRLDLIINNYYAFEMIRSYRMKGEQPNSIHDDFEEVDFVALLKKVCCVYERDLKRDEKYFKYEMTVPEFRIMARRDLLKLILLNIIDNAIKHSYNKTYVHIELKKDTEGIVLRVSNRGVGIPPDELEHVFKRYYQSSWKDRSRKREGSGYGLSIVRQAHKLMFPGGSVAIESCPWTGRKSEGRFPGDNYITSLTMTLPH